MNEAKILPKSPFIDWLSFSLPYTDMSWLFIQDRIGELNFRKTGFNGYTNSAFISGGGMLGFSPENQKNKLHVVLSAKALSNVSGMADEFLTEVLGAGGQVTRLDLALDDYDSIINIGQLKEKVINDEVRTRFRTWKHISSGMTAKQGITGETLYLGSGSSECMCRIYDKALQTNYESHWVRLEFELKKDKAHAVAKAISLECLDVSKFFYGYLDFIDLNHHRKDRCTTSYFWEKFLRVADKERITLPKYDRGLEGLEEWVTNQTTGAWGLIALTKGKGRLTELLDEGIEKAENSKRYQKLKKDYLKRYETDGSTIRL